MKHFQNFPYFWNKKTWVGNFFHFSYFVTFFPLINALEYVCLQRPGHSLESIAQNEKWKYLYLDFLILRIWQMLKHYAGTFH